MMTTIDPVPPKELRECHSRSRPILRAGSMRPNGLGKPGRPSCADPTTFVEKHCHKRKSICRR
jgi:hypothetical protein